MYSPRISEQHIAQRFERLGYSPVYHSRAQVRAAIKHFSDPKLVEIKYRRDSSRLPLEVKLLRPLTKEESRFIENERWISKYDFRYWCSRYSWVKHFEANQTMVPFTPNIAQNIMMDVWAELEEQEVAIEIINGKARQLGVSTVDELAVGHRTQFYSYTNAIVASASPGQSEKMSDMMVRCYQLQPWWLLPACTAFREGSLIEFGRFNSGISIQHGSQVSGIGRGTTPSMVHLSEVASFQNPEALIDAALLRAVHAAPGVFMVFESTGEGRGNWFHFNWVQAVDGYYEGRARLCPVFLPWYVGSDKYPNAAWLRKRPVPKDWSPSQVTQNHAEKARQYVSTDRILSKHMPAGWRMPIEQMWFYESEYNEYRAKKELSNFLQEMPATADEMFQSSGYSAFDAELVSEYDNFIRPTTQVYGVVARPDLVPLAVQPYRSEVDPNRPPIDIQPLTNRGREQRVHIQLVPLRPPRSIHTFDPNNKVLIFDHPDPQFSYGTGEDLSEGVEGDSSVINIIRKGDGEHPIKQVCEFASNNLNAVGCVGISYALGCYYSPNPDQLCRHTIEINTGEPTQLELLKLGWSNFHRWCRYDNAKMRPSNKLGWFTLNWSRWLMLDYLIHFLRNHLIDIQSPWFVDEMRTLQKANADAKMEAAYGAHDDRIMSLGIGFFSLHIWDHVFKMGQVENAATTRLSDLYVPVYEPRPQPISLPTRRLVTGTAPRLLPAAPPGTLPRLPAHEFDPAQEWPREMVSLLAPHYQQLGSRPEEDSPYAEW